MPMTGIPRRRHSNASNRSGSVPESPEEMKAEAVRFQQDVDARVALQLKEPPAPTPGAAQERSLSGNLPTPSASRLNYGELLRSGKPMPPAVEIDRLTAAWLAGQGR